MSENSITGEMSKQKELTSGVKHVMHKASSDPQPLSVIISSAQREAFSGLLSDTRKEPKLLREIQSSAKKALKGSQLYRLNPFLDSHKIIRVGGRLRRAQMEYNEKHPIVLPKRHYVSQLIAKHYHYEVHHQGRQITGVQLDKKVSGLLEVMM